MDNDNPLDQYMGSDPGYNPSTGMVPTLPTVNVEIISLILTNTGGYNDPVIRPYQTHITMHDLNKFTDRIATVASVGNVTPSSIAGHVSNILTVSGNGQQAIQIPNGWNTDRLRFTLIVRIHPNSLGRSKRMVYFQGYTEYSDLSMTGKLDPNMKFFINSFVETEEVEMPTPTGIVVMPRLIESTNILPAYQPSINNTYIRPNDIFNTMQFSHMDHSNKISIFQDTRVDTNEPTRSYKSNNNAGQYLSKIINNYLTSSRQNDIDMMINPSINILDAAIDRNESRPLVENDFIRQLAKAYNSSYRSVSHFTLNQLANIDNNIQYKIKYIKPQTSVMLPHSGQSEAWYTTTRETVASTIILNSLSAIMLELLISKIKLSSTNMQAGGQMVTVIYDAKSITGLDISEQLQKLVARLEREIIYEQTFQNQDSYQLNVEIDLFGFSSLEIGFLGQPMVPYIQASFADSLFSPVISWDKNSRTNIANDLNAVLDSVSQVANSIPAATNPGF